LRVHTPAGVNGLRPFIVLIKVCDPNIPSAISARTVRHKIQRPVIRGKRGLRLPVGGIYVWPKGLRFGPRVSDLLTLKEIATAVSGTTQTRSEDQLSSIGGDGARSLIPLGIDVL